MDKCAAFVAQGAGHGTRSGIAPDVVGHGPGGRIEQFCCNVTQAGTRRIQIEGMQAQGKLPPACRGNPARMPCGQAIAQHMGAETSGFVTSPPVGKINGEMDCRAGCGRAMKGKTERGGGGCHHDGAPQLVGLIEYGTAQRLPGGKGRRGEAVNSVCQADDAGCDARSPDHGHAGDGYFRVMWENVSSSAGRRSPIPCWDWACLPLSAAPFRRDPCDRWPSAA